MEGREVDQGKYVSHQAVDRDFPQRESLDQLLGSVKTTEKASVRVINDFDLLSFPWKAYIIDRPTQGNDAVAGDPTKPAAASQISVNATQIEQFRLPFKTIRSSRMACMWIGNQGRPIIKRSTRQGVVEEITSLVQGIVKRLPRVLC